MIVRSRANLRLYSRPVILPTRVPKSPAKRVPPANPNDPINCPRFWVGSILIASVLLVFYKWGRAAEPLMLAGLVFVFIFIFPYSDSFRRTLDPNAAMDRIENTTALEEITGKADYDAFELSASAADYVDHNGYLYGENLLGAVFFPMPKSIWPGKPRNSGSLIGAYKSINNLDLSMPLFSEFYLSGGYPLAFLGMFFHGLASANGGTLSDA